MTNFTNNFNEFQRANITNLLMLCGIRKNIGIPRACQMEPMLTSNAKEKKCLESVFALIRWETEFSEKKNGSKQNLCYVVSKDKISF